MNINRRQFLGLTGAAAGTILAGTAERARASGPTISQDAVGCLVDTTLCIGCRKCEQACNERHKLPEPEVGFEDLSAFEDRRRPDSPRRTYWTSQPPNYFVPCMSGAMRVGRVNSNGEKLN